MAEPAEAALTTFPPGDCGASLAPTDIVHEYVFAEFQPVARKVDELQTSLTLDFPGNKAVATVGGERPTSSAFKPALTWSAMDVYGGVPLSRAFDEDVSDLTGPLVPLTEVDDVLPLLDARGRRRGRGPRRRPRGPRPRGEGPRGARRRGARRLGGRQMGERRPAG